MVPKDEMIVNNISKWGKKEYLKWGEPRFISDNNEIEIIDPNHKWYGLKGYLLRSRPDGTVAVYIPMTKRKGMSGVLNWKQCKRIGGMMNV